MTSTQIARAMEEDRATVTMTIHRMMTPLKTMPRRLRVCGFTLEDGQNRKRLRKLLDAGSEPDAVWVPPKQEKKTKIISTWFSQTIEE
jgi:hypothetical protein